jgi:hypothetical protein
MCSTQWDAPVIPGHSFFEPTRYQTQTLAVGLALAGASTTLSPFVSVNNRSGGRGTPELTIAFRESARLITRNERCGN